MVRRSESSVTFKPRFKRGVFDFVGQVSKILFGMLDSSDVDYNKQIDLLYNNSQQLTELYKKQISIMQSTIGNITTAFASNQQKFKEIDFNLELLNKQMLNITRQITDAQLNTIVNSHLTECSEMMLDYELELEILTDAILLSR